MTLSRLNNDCIYFIVKLLQNNHSTLFNCLLINKHWCEVTVPFLYANPFSNLNDKKLLIINTFFLCLNEKERSYLIQHDDDICRKLKIFFQNNHLKPIFEYPKYIKTLSKTLMNAIDNWCKKQKKINNNTTICNPLFIKVTFYHMFLRQSNCIKDLVIFSDIFNENNIFDIQFINAIILKISSNLNTLQLHYSSTLKHEEILKIFVDNCKNLNQLSLEQFIPNNLNEISLIIRQQHELKKFDYHIFITDPIDDIFSSLEFQKNSLISLKLYNITFQKSVLQSIIKLHNLKQFEIDSFNGMTLELCDIFEFASFKLKKLNIKNRFCESNITSQIIKHLAGVTLKILKVKYLEVEIMKTISQYSLNLKTLDIEENLSILPYLKPLKIKNLNIHLNTKVDESFFIDLAKNLPETTNNVSFITWRIMDKNSLLSFLNNCHNYIISLNFKWKFELGHLKVILNYIKRNNNNNLKYLRICDLDKVWDTKELDLLDQIKEKGVKLVEFIDNYDDDYSFSD